MELPVLLVVAALGLIVLVGIYRLFASAPGRAQDSDGRFGPGPADSPGGGD
jgi:hypothetical protein